MGNDYQTRRDIDKLYNDVYDTKNGTVKFIAFKEDSEYRIDTEPDRSDYGTIDAIIDSYNLTDKADTNHTHTKSQITDFSHTHTSSDVTDLSSTIINLIYPVGSIYISVNNTDPSNLFTGTTWVQLKDRFLLGAGDTYPLLDDNDEPIMTSGEASHTLTVDEIPSHDHLQNQWTMIVSQNGNTGSWQPTSQSGGVQGTIKDDGARTTRVTDPKGGGQAHNNMPPYLVVYMWKRTE